MTFDDLAATTELIARECPEYLKDWLFVVVSKGVKVTKCVQGVTHPSTDRLIVLAEKSTFGAEIIAEFREMTRIALESSP